MSRPKIAIHELREKIEYIPETGEFFALKHGKRIGKYKKFFYEKRGSEYFIKPKEACVISCKRAAYAIMEGRWPKEHTTFKDGDSGNLKWSNILVKQKNCRPMNDNLQIAKRDILEMTEFILQGNKNKSSYMDHLRQLLLLKRNVRMFSGMAIIDIIDYLKDSIPI